jgi:hypothetical protein
MPTESTEDFIFLQAVAPKHNSMEKKIIDFRTSEAS